MSEPTFTLAADAPFRVRDARCPYCAEPIGLKFTNPARVRDGFEIVTEPLRVTASERWAHARCDDELSPRAAEMLIEHRGEDRLERGREAS